MNRLAQIKRVSICMLLSCLLVAPLTAAELPGEKLAEVKIEKGWLSEKNASQLYEEHLLHQAIEVYKMTLPALNMVGMRDGSHGQFGSGNHVLPIWKDRMDGRTLVNTPNADVIYGMGYLDLKKDGPVVVYAPPGVIGLFDDFMQRPLTDVGLSGPDGGKGGLYLLLPPDYQGHVPGGYYTFRSATYNVFLFWRMVLTQGPDGPETAKGVAAAEQTLIYPLSKAFMLDRPKMEFPNASFVPVNMQVSKGFAYWQKLKALIDYEPVEFLAPEVRGMLAAIGIIKGQPFAPDNRTEQILTRAAELAPKTILAARMQKKPQEAARYYKDRQWSNVFAGVDANWMKPSYLDTELRAAFFQFAYSAAPAMVVGTINKGAKYPATNLDADGNLLRGENRYRMHIPPDIPVWLYWAVTAYNPYDGSMQITGQKFPTVNSLDKLAYNEDGSIDLYFGPDQPEGVDPHNWIQTLPDKVFLLGFRLYGTKLAFFTKEWKPDDVVRLK